MSCRGWSVSKGKTVIQSPLRLLLTVLVAAIDLTLADMSGKIPLDLGGEIDFIGAESSPDFYKKDYSQDALVSKHQVFQYRRSLLYCGYGDWAGFVQHPNEWWHFSYGDQLWSCCQSNSGSAIYGRCTLRLVRTLPLSDPSLVT